VSNRQITKTIQLVTVVGVLMLVIGFITGLLFTKGVKLDSKLTVDGIVTTLGTLFAIIAATIVLPLAIQPVINRQSNKVNVVHDDINKLLALIDDVLTTCENIYLSNNAVTERQRKLILARHTDIQSLAKLLKEHSDQHEALKHFDAKIYEPLNNSHTDFSDNVMPSKKLTSSKLLAIRNHLEPITYELRNIRYELN